MSKKSYAFEPLFHPIRRNVQSRLTRPRFSALCVKRHVQFTSSFDWFLVLSFSFVFGYSDCFEFGFTTLN